MTNKLYWNNETGFQIVKEDFDQREKS